MNNIEQITQFFNENEKFNGLIKLNESLSKHTTMNVGGMAKLFLEPEDSESLIVAADKFIEEKINFFVLGGGSNVIISDNGLDVVVSTRKMNQITFCEKIIQIGCGSSWSSVISFCKKNNLGGFEAFTGLSGTVGGALYMNATCFGLSACDNLVSVEYLDLCDMKIHTYEKNPADWGYKKSPFQTGSVIANGVKQSFPQQKQIASSQAPRNDENVKIILSAKFSVHAGFDSELSEKCITSRKEKGHFRAPSSGSAFKNDTAHGIIAGKVIDECGLKGFSVGAAQIAPWHGNFIINPERKASASDIKKLSDEVRRIVLEKTGTALESEILFIGL